MFQEDDPVKREIALLRSEVLYLGALVAGLKGVRGRLDALETAERERGEHTGDAARYCASWSWLGAGPAPAVERIPVWKYGGYTPNVLSAGWETGYRKPAGEIVAEQISARSVKLRLPNGRIVVIGGPEYDRLRP